MLRTSKWFVQGLMVFGALMMVAVSVVKVRAEGDAVEMGIVQKDSVGLNRESMPTISEEVNYYLPYPGMLSDHPLYFVKMFRDRFREWVIIDQARKAEYWAFLADKRVAAGKVLIEGGKPVLGVSAYQKASKYLQRSTNKVEELKKNGKEMGDLANKLEQATLKYDEVLERSEQKNEGIKGQIDEVKKEIDESRKKVLKVLDRV